MVDEIALGYGQPAAYSLMLVGLRGVVLTSYELVRREAR